MSTLIFGAGAIGQWLGALLFSSGSDVQLHVRPRVAEVIGKQGGIVLNDSAPIQIPFSCELEELKGKTFHTVISTVKTFAVEGALKDLAKANMDFEHLVAFQNGWGTEELYVNAFPNRKFWVLTTTRAVGVDQPGRLTTPNKGGLAIAPWDPKMRVGIPDGLRKVSIPLVKLGRGLDLKWSKLLLNIIGNATGAITGLTPQHLADHPQLMKTELELARETLAVGRGLGVRRMDLPSFPVKILAGALEKLPLRIVTPIIAARMRRARGEKLPSLFFDLQEPNRPTEIDHLNGAVAREGSRMGIPAPKQRALTDLFHQCRHNQDLWQQIQQNPSLLMDYV